MILVFVFLHEISAPPFVISFDAREEIRRDRQLFLVNYPKLCNLFLFEVHSRQFHKELNRPFSSQINIEEEKNETVRYFTEGPPL